MISDDPTTTQEEEAARRRAIQSARKIYELRSQGGSDVVGFWACFTIFALGVLIVLTLIIARI